MDGPSTKTGANYQSGLGNYFSTEALPGALPRGQNSPQKAPYGLYAEGISGAAFTVPRAESRQTWCYRIRPTAKAPPYAKLDADNWLTPSAGDKPASPNQMRWDPLPLPGTPTDLIDGMQTYALCGDAHAQAGIGIHLYAANTSMTDRYFHNADGEMLFVPQQGRLILHTELGTLDAAPGEIAVIPRGIKFRAELPEGPSRGYVCENYGVAMRLPELGPIGTNGLANPRDFLTPNAAFEDRTGTFELVFKFDGGLWTTEIDRSPGLPSLMVTTLRRLMPHGTSCSFLQAVTQALHSMQRSASQRNFALAILLVSLRCPDFAEGRFGLLHLSY